MRSGRAIAEEIKAMQKHFEDWQTFEGDRLNEMFNDFKFDWQEGDTAYGREIWGSMSSEEAAEWGVAQFNITESTFNSTHYACGIVRKDAWERDYSLHAGRAKDIYFERNYIYHNGQWKQFGD